MTDIELVPPETILRARRALEGLPHVVLVDDWRWYPTYRRWVLTVGLHVASADPDRVPPKTNWIFAVEPEYPAGFVWAFPAKRNGLEKTFQHQRINLPGDPHVPWRTGNICLAPVISTPDDEDPEPVDDRGRLQWCVRRTLAWLGSALTGTLVRAGDPFELPDFPFDDRDAESVAFNEDSESFHRWSSDASNYGVFDASRHADIRGTLLVQCFRDPKGRVLYQCGWGKSFRDRRQRTEHGIWIRLPFIPVIDPWQAPTTWGELEACCTSRGVNLDAMLERACDPVRNGKGHRGRSHLGLIGFPVPQTFGQPTCRFHWQAFDIPPLHHSGRHQRGYRPKPENLWAMDRRTDLAPTARIAWRPSFNWNQDEISTRGRFPESVRRRRVCIIGAGALGSAVAELLARGGVTHLLVVDSDRLEMGNLVRHTSTMAELGRAKAETVVDRLNRISPHMNAKALLRDMPAPYDTGFDEIGKCDIIIDASAAPEAIERLSSATWPQEKLMVSGSINLGATRLYLYAHRGTSFPSSDFWDWIGPLAQSDRNAWTDEGKTLPWEGTGCWSPVFPARADDINIFAVAMVKEIVPIVEHPTAATLTVIYEQERSGEAFIGLRRV